MFLAILGGVWLFFFYMFTSKARGPYNRRARGPSMSNDTLFAAITATIITGLFAVIGFCSTPYS
ncbi:hypothetical protein NHF48_019780 [Sphingomonas sp. H160509]|uniref:hypothetical protein n=1 Tax=Sphingomonas sp. H160509 TaxID=2955313 RepID=UPI002097C319|nr:hypothetical protein [Sphingomonas sp. H160509]MDD1452659.1 hypothetical protein [Sphingomonas sp. H160509]